MSNLSNLKKGVNPKTGKEFLIFQLVGNKYNKYPESFQTRIGAETFKKEQNLFKSVILEKSSVAKYYSTRKYYASKQANYQKSLETKRNELRVAIPEANGGDLKFLQDSLKIVEIKLQSLPSASVDISSFLLN